MGHAKNRSSIATMPGLMGAGTSANRTEAIALREGRTLFCP